MQEHEYKARDKTVQKMSRDGLREENLRNKEEKRITGRDTDTEISRSEKKEELDFSKRRHERLKEEREMEQPEQSSRKPRYSREHADILDDEQDIATDADVEEGLTDDSSENPKSAFRTESIRGQPRGERAYLETVADSRDLRKKKMVRDYAAKERRKEKETSREEKAAKRESARYRETSEVMEDSLDKFHEEIKGKSKRERVLKEQRKKVSRLSFGDEGDGMVHGAGIGIRNPASAVKDAAVTAAHWKTHEEEDENAAVEGAHRAELVGESLARKSIYMRERLKGRREESRRLKESVLDEAERSRLIFETAYGNEAKDAVKREAEKKKKSALQKLFQKKRYQKQYQAARQSKKVKDAAITSAQKFTEKAKDAVKMVAAQNRGIFATVAVFALIFVLIAASFTSCTASLQGASSAIISTSYSSTDEDIYAAENAYRALEEALNTQINQMESTHPDYDEYRYQIDEIGHNPYQLISYLTVKYGGFTYDEVADEIKEIFRQQYGITTDSTRETVTETKTVRVGESLGLVVTSGYCNCPICCGQWSGGPTASGAMPTANHTIAVDAANPFVPIGTHVVMNGVEYVVEDTGAFARYGVQFDVYYDNHAAASAHGHQTWEAYIADSNGNQEVQVTTTKEVNRLDVTMTNHSLDAVLRSRMTEEEQERYDAYNKYYGNRDYLFDLNSIPTGSSGFGYDIPADALSDASPITAISLSDYNHLLKMAGYDEISLRDHEFTTQWLSITPQDSISAYLEAHKSIKTDGGDLQLADISAHTVDLGEDFYNFQSVIYIVPDHICNKLTSANTFRYMMADKTISYDIAQEIKSYFENSSLTDSLVTYNITMRTIEVNDNSAIIFIMQTGLTYSAIILFVTCFTILALQQLSDSGKYKYRFRVLRNMGVEEPHIRKLILKQLAVWFGVPVILALILSGAFLVFLFVGFHMQIAVYIGVQRLVQQLLIVLAILGVLLISYFISTWVLFNKSASA